MMSTFSSSNLNVAALVSLLFLVASTSLGQAQVVTVNNDVSVAQSVTIEIGSGGSLDVGWSDGVCYKPIQGGTGVFPGDKLQFTFSAHNVYQMASQQHFLDCNFTDATLLAQVGESPYTYTVPDEALNQVLYFACQVGDHCSSGTQKVQVPVTGFWGGGGAGDREAPISDIVVGVSAEDCNTMQTEVVSESDALEANRLLAECTDPEPVEGEPNTYFRSCLSGPATLTPGGVINRLFLMYYPFPTDRRVVVGQRNFEYVTGSFEEGITPVPVNQLYVHHLSGNIVFGQGAEGLRQDAPDAPFPEPYAILSGDEGDFTIMHLIDLREVDDWLPCIECRCPTSSEGTYLDELTGEPLITGGVNCCTNCTDLEGPTVDYRMRYNVTYREMQPEDEAVTSVKFLTADISPVVGMFLEHDVPMYEYLPEDQRHPTDPRIQRLERIEPFNQMFKMNFFQGDYDGPEEVQLLRCVAHLHVASIGQWLEDAETGEVLCVGDSVYGTDPETDKGFLTSVTVDDHDPPKTFPADRVVRFVTDYNATNVHTGVMGYWFVFVATPHNVTAPDTNLTVDLCVQATCDASLLPAIDMTQFQPESATTVEKRQADNGCVDTIADSPSCSFGGLCDCETFVNAPESTGCNGFYSSAFGDIEVRSLCANYCGCDVAEAVDEAMETVPETVEADNSAEQTFSNCKDDLVDHPACTFGGLCDCEELVSAPESTGCGGVYSTEMGDIAINDVCASFCGACEAVSLDELFEEVYVEAATMSLKEQCQFSTEACQLALNNMVSCAEGQPGIDNVDPMVRIVVEKHGYAMAQEGAKLGHPSLHVNQEDQVVGLCPGVEESNPATVPEEEEEEDEEPATIEAAEEQAPVPAPASGGDCTDTLSSHPACRFGGLCDCKDMVNAPQTEGYGCNGVYKSNMGDIAVLSVCASYCGCPGGQPPEVSSGGGPAMCFSEDSTIQVLGKGIIAMKDLNVGDRILGGDLGTYEQVYGFAHYEPSKGAEFFMIETNIQEMGTLTVTGDHLVYANNKFVAASSIQVGDTLQAEGSSAVVTKIASGWKKGLYAPLTPSGSLLVNGVKVSSYVTLKTETGFEQSGHYLAQHGFLHMMMSPLRIACLGISQSLCSTDKIDQENGYLPYVGFWIRMAGIVDRHLPVLLQWALYCLGMLVFYPLYCAESIMGASLLPGALALVGIAAMMFRLKKEWKAEAKATWKNWKMKMA